ncbi:MAG: NAD(P)/FAD-dependent oxidoreductase [Hyphomicrobium sp.]|uniref:NAD(P)/FAD-dependent oxidoreductase n=1 Tax=Hyphomicrobium sp. TaxID=82 RepID=UPI003D0EEF82
MQTPVTARHAIVIGGGPAGLMAAETLANAGVAVTLYERMPRVARKLLLAGRGGLNLTHGEPLDQFLSRYREAAPRLAAAIEAFPPEALRAWCEGLGEATFVGTSGRVFPRAMKTSPLLRAWLARLARLGVEIRLGHRWTGWDEGGALLFETEAGRVRVEAACTVLALGGASWPRLGSDAGWVAPLAAKGVAVTPLAPSNCGVRVAWSEVFRARFAGAPLKRIAGSAGGETVRGEAMITASGLEGGAVYALSAPIRNALAADGMAEIAIDLRPDIAKANLAARLAKPRGKQSLATHLRKALSLDAPAIGLLHEAAHTSGTPLTGLEAERIARLVKGIPVRVTGLAPIDRAISTSGGVAFDAVDEAFMLRARPGTFVAGEMLDWDAPTGGYLLQACFATARSAAFGALSYLAQLARA